MKLVKLYIVINDFSKKKLYMLHVHYMNKILPRDTIMLQTIRIYVMWIVWQLH